MRGLSLVEERLEGSKQLMDLSAGSEWFTDTERL